MLRKLGVDYGQGYVIEKLGRWRPWRRPESPAARTVSGGQVAALQSRSVCSISSRLFMTKGPY